MNDKELFLAFASMLAVAWLFGCTKPGGAKSTDSKSKQVQRASQTNKVPVMKDSVKKSDADWKKELTDEQYRVLREKGTERAFTGQYWNHKEDGVYRCAGCGNELFGSETKFDSGCGWPSFVSPLSSDVVETTDDNSHSMHRTEVLCRACGGHLGHVFDDGPQPTGLRYCINSASLKFEGKASTGQTSKKE